jgi:hypothetical protein
MIHSYLSSLLERRPYFGYLFASISSTGGFLGIIESATKIVGFIAAIVGLIVGVYTLRIQHRVWKDVQKK